MVAVGTGDALLGGGGVGEVQVEALCCSDGAEGRWGQPAALPLLLLLAGLADVASAVALRVSGTAREYGYWRLVERLEVTLGDAFCTASCVLPGAGCLMPLAQLAGEAFLPVGFASFSTLPGPYTRPVHPGGWFTLKVLLC
jgi:hypothetical protein